MHPLDSRFNNLLVPAGCLLAILIGVLAVVHDAAWSMVVLWSTTDTYMHGWFVIPLAAIMAKNKPVPNIKSAPAPIWQVITIVSGWSVVLLIGRLAMLNVVQQLALISLIPMMVIFHSGWRVAWHYRAPLILVFFCIPFGDFLIPWLQSVTADMAMFLLHASDVTVVRNGWYISIPAADFRVAEACSGINFLISTFTVSIFYSFTYMTQLHKRVTFIALGLLVPLIANGIRVYLIIMIAHWGNVEAATGFDHLVYGWIFFFVILAALFTIGNRWQDPIPELEKEADARKKLPFSFKANSLAVIAVAIPLCSILLDLASNIHRDIPVIGEPISSELSINPLRPKFPAADALSQTMVDGWVQYQAVYLNENVDKKMIGYQNRWFDGNIWSIKNKAKDTLVTSDGVHIPVSKWTLVGLSGKEYQLAISYCVGGEWAASVMKAKALQVQHKALLKDDGGVAYGWFSSALGTLSNMGAQISAKKMCP
ncbi:hypothetical protein BM525_21385 (plasmid) [Alteromonas mediterranea]|uniref:Exosortase A n=1 Tax=Alteromonas mediterranea TaxID=314275 RepID=A0AAC9JE71_9ALTE|nr:exosortase A [Alteromonas mediterranea]APD92414.1 hypothetical protein BM524_21165 [Alteromonas mediterranea]APE00275.1 hypothetical protein BM525_21385 [Alteromonas mediterranea]